MDPVIRNQLDCKQIEAMKGLASEKGLYLEWGGAQHIPRDMTNWEKRELFDLNRIAAEEATNLGARIVRSCSGGLMRWNPANPATRQLLEEMTAALSAQEQMLRDHGVILAIETHFEFTTFELLRVFQELGARPGEWIGICLDTMNLMTMLEDPVLATERILPWVVSTHIKDGGILITERGFQTFTAPIGQGIIDFTKIFSLLGSIQPLNLNIEDHGGEFDVPVNDPVFRREFPDLTGPEMDRLMLLARETRSRVDAGTLSPLPREEWPSVCEQRLAADLAELKKMA
ncbi:MAG: sugar phosphate isomerase/epimerase family protein [Bacteroidales bacterium]